MKDKVDKYFEGLGEKQKDILRSVRGLLREMLPEAEEIMSYGVPAFKLMDKTIMYAAFKEHVGIYPDPKVIERFEEQLKGYQTSKGTIKFPLDKPIPFDLIKDIVRYKFELNS